MMRKTQEIIKILKSHANPSNVAGMSRFGINPKGTLGIAMPILRKCAKEFGKDHLLALGLWKTGIHEARILAGLIDNPNHVTSRQMDEWAADFDSWDVCDTVCMNLFDKTKFAFQKAKQWTSHNREFERRAGFALMASLAFHDKNASDSDFLLFFPLIEQYAVDERNFVKKSVNWALRQIGKRNARLCTEALKLAENLKTKENPTARWIGSDAYRELIQKQSTNNQIYKSIIE